MVTWLHPHSLRQERFKMNHDSRTIALAILTSGSYDEARTKLGKMSRTKFWQLRQSKEIKEAISSLSTQLYEETLAQTMSEMRQSLNTLKALSTGQFQDSQKAFVQLAACKYLLEIAHKGYELKALNSRIDRLEHTVNALP